jgi:MFS family permease
MAVEHAPAGRRGRAGAFPQLGVPLGMLLASAVTAMMTGWISPGAAFIEWGWRYPFFVAFAINVVALFARLRLVLTDEYTQLLEEGQLEPISTREMVREQGYNIFLGAFAALASYALFHLVTVFPLSWVLLQASQEIDSVLTVQIVGAFLAMIGTIVSGVIADRVGRRKTLGALAVLIGIFSLFAPYLLGGSEARQDVFILVGFTLLGLSYGQASGTVTSNFETKYRYTGAALTSDFAWLFGAAFAPLVALGLSDEFGLVAVSVYLLSGAVCTLVALRINRLFESRD